MHQTAQFLFALGAILLLGLAADYLGRRTFLPRVTLLLVGVAIGMSLIAANRFPEYSQVILSVVISTTVLFELAGPAFTRLALKKTAGQALEPTGQE